MACGTYRQYAVEEGYDGYPKFFTGDKKELEAQVKAILKEHGPSLSLHTIYQIGKSRHNWEFGCMWDGIYAVVERATRSVATMTWTLID
jgi:hypothetical protein